MKNTLFILCKIHHFASTKFGNIWKNGKLNGHNVFTVNIALSVLYSYSLSDGGEGFTTATGLTREHRYTSGGERNKQRFYSCTFISLSDFNLAPLEDTIHIYVEIRKLTSV